MPAAVLAKVRARVRVRMAAGLPAETLVVELVTTRVQEETKGMEMLSKYWIYPILNFIRR